MYITFLQRNYHKRALEHTYSHTHTLKHAHTQCTDWST